MHSIAFPPSESSHRALSSQDPREEAEPSRAPLPGMLLGAGSTRAVAPADAPAPSVTSILFERFRGGDQDAYEPLVRRLDERLRRFVRVLLGDRLRSDEQACDIVQETLLRAIPRLSTFEPHRKGALMSFVTKIARNLVRDLARARRSPRLVASPDEDPFWLGLEQASEPAPGDGLALRELNAILDEAASRLAERDRDIVARRHVLGSSWEEIVEAMGFESRGAASMCYLRAKARWMAIAGPRLRPWLASR